MALHIIFCISVVESLPNLRELKFVLEIGLVEKQLQINCMHEQIRLHEWPKIVLKKHQFQ